MAKSPGRTAAIVCSVLACFTGSVLGLGPPINLRAEGLPPVVTTEEATDKTTTDDDACDLGPPIPSADIPRHDLPGGRSREHSAVACAQKCCAESRCGGYTFAQPVAWASPECPLSSGCCFLKDHAARRSSVAPAGNTSSALRPAPPTPPIPKGGGACGSIVDCMGGGVCAAGKCQCDVTFTGEHCLMLDLLPIAGDAGLPSAEGVAAQATLPTNSTFPWGGALVEDDSGLFHLFFTEWLNNCPMRYDTFATSTHIAHATAKDATGPWTRQGVAVPPAAGNPAMTRAPDGTYLLYYTNHRYLGAIQNCSEGPASSWGPPIDIQNSTTKCKSGKGHVSMGISLAYSKSLDGPWTYEEDVITVPASNPGGPVFFANGSLMLPFQTWPPAAPCTTPSCITVVTSPHWKNWPYSTFPLGEPGTAGHCIERQDPARGGAVEDPSNIWRDQRGTLHVLMHEKSFGSRAWSTDGGTSWAYDYSNIAYPYSATTSNGSSISCASGREEPRVLLDPKSGQPTALATLCQKGGGPLPNTHYTRVLIQKLKA